MRCSGRSERWNKLTVCFRGSGLDRNSTKRNGCLFWTPDPSYPVRQKKGYARGCHRWLQPGILVLPRLEKLPLPYLLKNRVRRYPAAALRRIPGYDSIYSKVPDAFETTEVINCYTPLVPASKFKALPRAGKMRALEEKSPQSSF